MDKKKVKQEKERLISLLDRAEVQPQNREVLTPVIDNISWQKVKLEEAMKQMQNESLTCEYNNGGNQTGIRENPIFKAYVNLWRAYMVGLEKYTSYLPKEYQEEIKSSVDILTQVKNMKKANI